MGPDSPSNMGSTGTNTEGTSDYKTIPLFEPVLAPILKSTDKKSISIYLEKRITYEKDESKNKIHRTKM